MSEWQEVRLGDVLDKIVGGGTPSKENPSYWDGGDIFWCSVKDMSDDKFRISQTKDTITLDGLQNSSSNLIPKGTVITATRMGLGRAFINETDMAINQDLKALIPNSTIDNKYLLWTIILYRNYIEMLGNGATVKGIRLETFKNIKINLPPLPTQQKIAKILSNYDDLIENNLKRIKLLEESARLTYEEWFLRFRIDGKKLDIDPATNLPFGWEKISLSDTGEFLNGYAFKPNDLQEEGLPVIKIKEMKSGVVEDTPRNPGDKINDKYLVLRGDILFSWSASLEVIQWQYANGWLNQHLFKVSPNSDFPKSFLYLSLRNSLHIFDYLTTGATMKHIKRKELDFVKIPTPSSDVLLKFDNLVNPMLEEILNLSHQNQLLKEARDILLPRLMTNMIDTDDMDIAV